MKNIAAIIPARYASTRFPGKPLVKIGDRTMIHHVWDRASEVFDHAWVATDDERIAHEVRSFGGRVVMTRADHPSGTDRIAEAVGKIDFEPDVVINIQGDEPFIATEQLRSIAELFDDPKCDIATLVQPFGVDGDIFNANAVKAVVGTDGYALYFSRAAIPFQRGIEPEQWAARHTYYKHIGLYGYRTEVLRAITELPQGGLERCESLEQLRWVENGYRIKTAVTLHQTIGIDTPEDLQSISIG